MSAYEFPSPAAPATATAGGPPAPVPILSRAAVGTLIFDLLSLLIWPFSVAIVILGPRVLRRIRNSEGRLIGSEWALTGIVAAWIGLVVWPVVAARFVTYNHHRHGCPTTTLQMEMGTLNTALLGFKNRHRMYPASLDQLAQPFPGRRSQRSLVDPEMLIDPWGQPYRYRVLPAGSEMPIEIHSSGPDQKDGTRDDVYLK